jgi:hypothetical protein
MALLRRYRHTLSKNENSKRKGLSRAPRGEVLADLTNVLVLLSDHLDHLPLEFCVKRSALSFVFHVRHFF